MSDNWFDQEWKGVKDTYFGGNVKGMSVSERLLQEKLDGVTDNTERYRIVDSFMSGREAPAPKSGGFQNLPYENGWTTPFRDTTNQAKRYDGVTPNYSYVGEKSNKPLMHEGFKVQKTSTWDKAKKIYNNYASKVGDKLPDYAGDRLRATFNGIDTREKHVSKLTKMFGMKSEFEGYNRISGQSFNIDFTHGWDDKTYEYWKQMQRDETRKYVRNIGDSVDPFAREPVTPYSREMDHVRALEQNRPPNMSKMENSAYDSQVAKARAVADRTPQNINRSRDEAQLAEIRKRLDSSKNDFKNFFNPMDKKEMDMLQSAHDRLEERMRRYNGHYTSDMIHSYQVDTPQSVSGSFSDLHARRAELDKDIKERRAKKGKTLADERSISMLSSELDFVDRSITARGNGVGADNKFGHGFGWEDPYKIPFSPEHIKDSYRPTYGTTGYGLGFKNSMAASRTEHLARAAHYMNPFGAGASSSFQALTETMGLMNKQQRLMASQARGLARIPHNIVPIAAAGMLFTSMADNKGPGEIVEDFVSMAGGLHGWRVGSALGGALNIGNKTKFLGLGIGGIAGAATGYLLGTAVVGGINDITSNDSKIRSFAKKLGTKESTVTMPETRQSLTARQASLQKLSRSGLNDRGLLLGNESSVLAGIM